MRSNHISYLLLLWNRSCVQSADDEEINVAPINKVTRPVLYGAAYNIESYEMQRYINITH